MRQGEYQWDRVELSPCVCVYVCYMYYIPLILLSFSLSTISPISQFPLSTSSRLSLSLKPTVLKVPGRVQNTSPLGLARPAALVHLPHQSQQCGGVTLGLFGRHSPLPTFILRFSVLGSSLSLSFLLLSPSLFLFFFSLHLLSSLSFSLFVDYIY